MIRYVIAVEVKDLGDVANTQRIRREYDVQPFNEADGYHGAHVYSVGEGEPELLKTVQGCESCSTVQRKVRTFIEHHAFDLVYTGAYVREVERA